MKESYIEIETPHGIMRGMFHAPQTEIGVISIIVHGYFSANHIGPASLYVYLAREIARATSSAVARFDFLGVGNSDGIFEDLTYETALRDTRAIVSYMQSNFNGVDVNLIGHSMGANVVLEAGLNCKGLRSIFMLAPDVCKKDNIDNLFTQEQLRGLHDKGWTIRKGLPINASFVNEIKSDKTFDLIGNYSIPVYIMQGSEDELYSFHGAERLASKAVNGTVFLVDGGDHNFISRTSKNNLAGLICSIIKLEA